MNINLPSFYEYDSTLTYSKVVSSWWLEVDGDLWKSCIWKPEYSTQPLTYWLEYWALHKDTRQRLLQQVFFEESKACYSEYVDTTLQSVFNNETVVNCRSVSKVRQRLFNKKNCGWNTQGIYLFDSSSFNSDTEETHS